MIFSFQKLDNFKTVMTLALAVGFITSSEGGEIKVSVAKLYVIHLPCGWQKELCYFQGLILYFGVLKFGCSDVESFLQKN